MENLAILVGRLATDPVLNLTDEGNPVARFRVETSDKWPDKKSGGMKERVELHWVEICNKRAKACADHLKKGSAVYIRGKLNSQYSKTIIKARKIKFL